MKIKAVFFDLDGVLLMKNTGRELMIRVVSERTGIAEEEVAKN